MKVFGVRVEELPFLEGPRVFIRNFVGTLPGAHGYSKGDDILVMSHKATVIMTRTRDTQLTTSSPKQNSTPTCYVNP
jgi:hypothetical protein